MSFDGLKQCRVRELNKTLKAPMNCDKGKIKMMLSYKCLKMYMKKSYTVEAAKFSIMFFLI